VTAVAAAGLLHARPDVQHDRAAAGSRQPLRGAQQAVWSPHGQSKTFEHWEAILHLLTWQKCCRTCLPIAFFDLPRAGATPFSMGRTLMCHQLYIHMGRVARGKQTACCEQGKRDKFLSRSCWHQVRDRGNCTPRAMRSTLSIVPATRDMLKQGAMPLALCITPLALPEPDDDPVPVTARTHVPGNIQSSLWSAAAPRIIPWRCPSPMFQSARMASGMKK